MRQQGAQLGSVSATTGALYVPPGRVVSVESFGATHSGPRTRNEDQFLVAELERNTIVRATSLGHGRGTSLRPVRGHVLIVADGVGDAAAGDLASRIAVQAVVRSIADNLASSDRRRSAPGEHLPDLRAAFEGGHRAVLAAADEADPAGGRRMATTLTVAHIVWPRLSIAHVGDSRCYLLRDGDLLRLTADHTVEQRLLDRGVGSESIAPGLLGVLTNAVGHRGTLHVDLSRHELVNGDVLLLCTDGLSSVVGNDTLRHIIRSALGAESACRHLLEAALQSGTRDNATCVVARFRELRQKA